MSEAAMFNLKPATRQTLGDSVADSIRDAIFGGLVKPGQRLAESQVASTFKVSRAPVRDALACLHKEGLVSRSANGGTTVALLTPKDIEEICTLRLPLELLAVQRVVRGDSAALRARLAKNVRATEGVANPRALARIDLDFHETIVEAADHARLLASWSNLRSQIQLVMVQRNLADDGSRRGTVRGHKELLKALRERDEARAVALMERHLQSQYEWVLGGLCEA